MQRGVLLIIWLLALSNAYSKDDKPQITGQKQLTTQQGQSIKISLNDLTVTHESGEAYENYPSGFTLELFAGDNYKISGTTVTPDGDFVGELSVEARVSIGKSKSKKEKLTITVVAAALPNASPTIIGQVALSTKSGEKIKIELADLYVSDADDDYPTGFTLKILAGDHYTLDGLNLTPETGYSGILTVPVIVNDGKDDSNTYPLQVTVTSTNVAPVITGQTTLKTVANTPLTIALSNLQVTDADNTYPDDFTMTIAAGNNYTVSGNQITPASGFTGTLTVNVSVSDGTNTSNVFPLQVTVFSGSELQIVSQSSLETNEDTAIQITTSVLQVNDPEKIYPSNFTVTIGTGQNYSVSANTITPSKDFFGALTVPVTITDGSRTSNSFDVVVKVLPVNDPPILKSIGETIVEYHPGSNPVLISDDVIIEDVDDQKLSLAEVGFETGFFQPGGDAIVPTVSSPNIRAVFDQLNGVLFLLGEAPIGDYVQVLQSLTYQFAANDSIQPQRSKRIYFEVSDQLSRSERKSVLVEFQEDLIVDIPTVFTPNEDNANDTWRVKLIQGSDVSAQLSIVVYSKSGKLVYESNSFEEEWDGTMNGRNLPSDAYYFEIELVQPQSKQTYKGIVTLLH